MLRSLYSLLRLVGQLPIGCLLAAFVTTHALAQDAAVVEHFRDGQQAAASQDFNRAITEFRAVLKIDPSLVQARANLGLMYYSIGQYEQAAHELSQVTRTDAGLLPAQLFLGLSDLKLGHMADAMAPLQRAQQLDPSNAQAARGLLACYVSLGRYSAALSELEFFKTQPGEESLFLTGQAYLDMGKTLTEHLASRYGGSAWAHQLAGDLAADRNDQTSAADEYRKARALDPSVQEATASTAAANLVTPVEKQETAEGLYRLIRADTALGEQYFKRLQDQFPDSTYAHELRGDVYRLRQDFPAALTEFQAALQNRQDDAELHRSVAEMQIQLHQLDEAKAELREADKLNPNNAETEFMLGQVYAKLDQTETAVESLKQAVRLNPNLLQARALLGTVYMHSGKPALAAPELQKALPLDYYGDLHFQLYKAYRALHQPALAETELAKSRQMRARTLNSAVAKISGVHQEEPQQEEQ